MPIVPALFEAASAIATVGVTLGITPDLCAASKVVLIIRRREKHGKRGHFHTARRGTG